MDDKQRKLLIITLILIPVFILALASSIRKIQPRYKPLPNLSTPAGQLPVLSTAEAPNSAVPVGAPEQKKDDSDWIRCPFSGKIYSGREGGTIDLRLTGIVWDDKRPQALINGAIVQEGDAIGNFRVLKIFKDKIKMASDGTYFEIRLEQ